MVWLSHCSLGDNSQAAALTAAWSVQCQAVGDCCLAVWSLLPDYSSLVPETKSVCLAWQYCYKGLCFWRWGKQKNKGNLAWHSNNTYLPHRFLDHDRDLSCYFDFNFSQVWHHNVTTSWSTLDSTGNMLKTQCGILILRLWCRIIIVQKYFLEFLT